MHKFNETEGFRITKTFTLNPNIKANQNTGRDTELNSFDRKPKVDFRFFWESMLHTTFYFVVIYALNLAIGNQIPENPGISRYRNKRRSDIFNLVTLVLIIPVRLLSDTIIINKRVRG